MTMIELRTLGDCQIVIGDERLGPQSPYAFALALFLAMERGRPHSRDELLAMFSPGVPEANAAHSLRQTLYKLRQLGVPAETTPAGTVIAASEVRDDYTALLATNELPDPHLERLPGQFLPGYWPKVSEEFTRWLEGQRDGVNGALRRAYVSRILDRRAVARWDEVERFARACLVVDPLNEEATLALAEALALSGSKAAGVKVLDRYLEEVGRDDDRLTLPATVLRKRIAERVQTTSGRYSPVPLVGRDSELRRLSRLTADAQAGVSQAVLITGVPGIGKTRLVREHIASLQISSAKVLEAACQPHDSRRPMSILVDLVPQLVRSSGAIAAAPQSLGLLERLHTVNVDECAPIVAPGATSDELAAAVTDAVSDVIDAVATRHLLVILFEDLHWADSLSRRVVLNLIAEKKHRRLLIIATSRETVPTSTSNGTQSILGLHGLLATESTELATALLADNRGNAAQQVLDRIVQLAGGNPFYLRALCDFYRVEGNVDRPPPVLSDMLRQRLAALRPLSRTAFAACVLLGRHATLARIERVIGVTTAELADALADLEESGLINPLSERLEVHHSLISNTLLATESLSRLSVVRRAVAAVLEEEADATGAVALYWDAAEHWVAGGDSDRAKSALRTCALHAANIGAAQDALEAIDRYAEAANESEAVALCDVVRTKVLRELSAPDRLLTDWRRMSRGSDSRASQLDFTLLAYELSRQQHGDAEQHLADLLRIIGDSAMPRRPRVRAASIAMCIADDIDDTPLAHHVATTLPITAADFWDTDPDMIRLLLVYHTKFGERDQALCLANSIAEWHDAAVLTGDSIRSLSNAGMACALAGDVSTSCAIFERVFRLSTTHGLATHAASAAAWRYLVARQTGDQAGCVEWTSHLTSMASQAGLQKLSTNGIYSLTVSALDDRDVQRAQTVLDEMKRRSPFISRSFHWAGYTAVLLRYSSLSGEQSVSDEDLTGTLAWSLRTASRSPDDEIALGVLTGLITTGRSDAASFLASYLSLRRSGAPILPHLTQTGAKLT